MPLFVFISGYLLAGSLNRRGVAETFRIRGKSLLVPFAVWSFLDLIVNYFLRRDGLPQSFFAAVAEYLFLKPSVWFLFTLFVCSSMILSSVQLQKRGGWIVFAAIYILVLSLPANDYGALYYIKWFYPFYAAGYFIHCYGKDILGKFNNPIVFVVCLVLFVGLASLWSKNDFIYVNKMSFLSMDYAGETLRYVYRYFVGLAGLAVAFFFGSWLAKTQTTVFWDTLGLYSLDIYLLQRYFVEGLYPKIFTRLHIVFDYNSPFFLCVYAPVITATAVFVCVIISKLFLRPVPLLNRLFLGGRG